MPPLSCKVHVHVHLPVFSPVWIEGIPVLHGCAYFGWSQCPHQSYWLHPQSHIKVKPAVSLKYIIILGRLHSIKGSSTSNTHMSICMYMTCSFLFWPLYPPPAVRQPPPVHSVVRATGILDVGLGGGAYAEAPPQSATHTEYSHAQSNRGTCGPRWVWYMRPHPHRKWAEIRYYTVYQKYMYVCTISNVHGIYVYNVQMYVQ